MNMRNEKKRRESRIQKKTSDLKFIKKNPDPKIRSRNHYRNRIRKMSSDAILEEEEKINRKRKITISKERSGSFGEQ